MSPTAALLPTVISIVIGAAFGYVSEWLAGALTKKGAVLSPAAA
jgi:Flp pilus assembly pilin Flp